jgi:hypothetical protein
LIRGNITFFKAYRSFYKMTEFIIKHSFAKFCREVVKEGFK